MKVCKKCNNTRILPGSVGADNKHPSSGWSCDECQERDPVTFTHKLKREYKAQESPEVLPRTAPLTAREALKLIACNSSRQTLEGVLIRSTVNRLIDHFDVGAGLDEVVKIQYKPELC